MSVELECLNKIRNITLSISKYLKVNFLNLTDAVNAIKEFAEKKDNLLYSIFTKSQFEITASDLEGFESVSDYFVYQNTGLKKVELPNSVKSIGLCAFFNCTGLKEIIFPNEITSIGSSAFSNCKGLGKTVLPDSIKTIDSSGFNSCTNLMIDKLPQSLELISNASFASCENLTKNLIIPENVKTIGRSAFYNCLSLETVTFKSTPEQLDMSAFASCYNLKTINVPWEEGKFASAPWGATNATVLYNTGA